MRTYFASLLVAAAGLTGMTAHADDSAVAAPTAKAAYNTAETPLGDLLDDPAAKAVLQKHLPDLISGDGIAMARGMTLKALQGYAADQVTDEKLAAIDADLQKLAGK
ncbi:hypothetical protein [Novosphingobium endophyticum]|nr:hypothetical protein [Novosphingobium endophyticum]